MSVLRKIYDGNYYPSEQIIPTSQEYRDKRNACNLAQENLERALGTDKESFLTEFLDRYADVMDLMQYEFFREGVRFGLALEREWQAGQGSEALVTGVQSK